MVDRLKRGGKRRPQSSPTSGVGRGDPDLELECIHDCLRGIESALAELWTRVRMVEVGLTQSFSVSNRLHDELANRMAEHHETLVALLRKATEPPDDGAPTSS